MSFAHRSKWLLCLLATVFAVLPLLLAIPAAATDPDPVGTSLGPLPPPAQPEARAVPAAPGAFRVAVFSEISGFDPQAVANALNTDPRIVATVVGRTDVAAGLPGYKVLVARFGETAPTARMVQGVRSLVSRGGGFVGEWWGAGAALSGIAPAPDNFFEPNHPMYLFAGRAAGGDSLATPVTMTKPSPITAGLPGVLRAEGATEFFVRAVPPRDLRLKTVATFRYNGGTFPAIAEGAIGGARVALIFFDAGDRPDLTNIRRLFVNAVYWAAS